MSGIAEFFGQIIRLYHIPITFLGADMTPFAWVVGIFIVGLTVKFLFTLLDFHFSDFWGFWGPSQNDKDIK